MHRCADTTPSTTVRALAASLCAIALTASTAMAPANARSSVRPDAQISLDAVADGLDGGEGHAAEIDPRELDARIDAAYNECRIAQLFARDAELYFAGRGAARRASGYAKRVRSGFCGRYRRESAQTLLHADALPPDERGNAGAIQTGAQDFCAIGTQPCNGERMKFLAIWRRIDGEWKITRMVHYGHLPLNAPAR